MHEIGELAQEPGQRGAFSLSSQLPSQLASHAVETIRDLAGGGLAGVRVACLGAAASPPSIDPLDAAAHDIARLLHLEGAIVTVYDPRANETEPRAALGLICADSMIAAIVGADVVALLTDRRQFREAKPDDFSRVVSQKKVFDARRALDAADYRARGWEYRAPITW